MSGSDFSGSINFENSSMLENGRRHSTETVAIKDMFHMVIGNVCTRF
jgi:hypothetical protein